MSEEQQKLSRRERRAQAKTGTAEGSEPNDVKDRNQKLRADAATRRRRARQDERSAAATEGLDASERMDDAFVRGSAATGRFLRSNFVWLQWIVIAGVAGSMGYLVFNYQKGIGHEKEGSLVASILAAQFGRITASDPIEPADARLIDPRKEYASDAERENAASQAWQRLDSTKSPALALLGKLGRAGALYDQSKYGEARDAYNEALKNAHIGLHPQFKGRALEGVAFTLEAEEKLDEAIKAFEKLKNLDLPEFESLATFHIARVEFLKGNTKGAIELLSQLDTKLSKNAGPEGPTDYVGAAVRDLLKTADPARAKKEQQAISKAQMEKFMKQFQEMQKKKGASGLPSIPGLPNPVPPPAAPESSEEPADETEPDATAKPVPPKPGPAGAAPTKPTTQTGAAPKTPQKTSPTKPKTAPTAPAKPKTETVAPKAAPAPPKKPTAAPDKVTSPESP